MQIILSGNCPPSQLKNIEDRLISRFEWGLTISLSQATYAVKKCILIKKMQAFSLSLDATILEFLLKTFLNLHSLIRAVDVLVLRNHYNKTAFDLEVIKVLLKDLIEKENAFLLSPAKNLKSCGRKFWNQNRGYFRALPNQGIFSSQTNFNVPLPEKVKLPLSKNRRAIFSRSLDCYFERKTHKPALIRKKHSHLPTYSENTSTNSTITKIL